MGFLLIINNKKGIENRLEINTLIQSSKSYRERAHPLEESFLYKKISSHKIVDRSYLYKEVSTHFYNWGVVAISCISTAF